MIIPMLFVTIFVIFSVRILHTRSYGHLSSAVCSTGLLASRFEEGHDDLERLLETTREVIEREAEGVVLWLVRSEERRVRERVRLEACYDNPNALRDYFRDIGCMVLAAEGCKANDSHAD